MFSEKFSLLKFFGSGRWHYYLNGGFYRSSKRDFLFGCVVTYSSGYRRILALGNNESKLLKKFSYLNNGKCTIDVCEFEFIKS